MTDDVSKKLLLQLTDTMKEAAAEVQRLFLSRDFDVREKGPGDLLTSADLLSNEILFKSLSACLPEAAWISEESAQSESRRQHSLAWIVDPIDGTKEFATGRPEYSISVGLVADGLPVLGAVALPAEGLLFVGSLSEGLKEITEAGIRDLPPIRSRPLAEASILISRTESDKGLFDPKHFSDLHLTPTGSVARKLALVAAGRADASISLYPKNEWDICGGVALILSAGGLALHCDGVSHWSSHAFNAASLISYGIIAGSAELVAELCQRQKAEGWILRRTYGQ